MGSNTHAIISTATTDARPARKAPRAAFDSISSTPRLPIKVPRRRFTPSGGASVIREHSKGWRAPFPG